MKKPIELCGVLVFLLILAVAALPHAISVTPAPARGYSTDCKVLRVVDGDTLECQISYTVRVRLLGCWAPETRSRDLHERQKGRAAKLYMQSLAPAGTRCRLHIPGGESLADILTFGRLLGRLWVIDPDTRTPQDVDVSDQMVAAGHATAEKTP